MSRLADAYHYHFPDDSPEPSCRRAYYTGVATMEAIVSSALNNPYAPAHVRREALDTILAMVRLECDREGVR